MVWRSALKKTQRFKNRKQRVAVCGSWIVKLAEQSELPFDDDRRKLNWETLQGERARRCYCGTEDKFNFLPAKIKSHMCRLQPASQSAAATPGCEKETDESGFCAELAVPDKKNKIGLKRGGCGRVIAQSTNVGAIDERKLKNCKLRYAGMIDWYSSKSNCHFWLETGKQQTHILKFSKYSSADTTMLRRGGQTKLIAFPSFEGQRKC